MNQDAQAILLDVGNTLRVVIEDPAFQAEARQQLAELVGTAETPDAFCERLETRYKIYRKWAFETLIEASERELWTRFMLPDYPAERIGPLAGRLTRLWRDRDGRREPRPDVSAVVIELHRRGYVLGIIANTITETEIPDWLERDNLTGYFKAVVLSSIYGRRKPGPEIYLEASRLVGVDPAACVYVGDNPIRDVEGTRLAGYGMAIILVDSPEGEARIPTDGTGPDRVIHSCSDLLDLFPARQPQPQP